MLPDIPFSFDPLHYPEHPGCFIVRGAHGEILLAGKGANLRERITDLLQAPPSHGSQRPHRRYLELRADLLARMRSIEVILTHGEEESLPLTNAMIQRWRPVFNLATFLDLNPASYIYPTRETYPRLLPLGEKRARKQFGAQAEGDDQPLALYGPFPGGPVRDLLLKIIGEHYRLRTCHPLPTRACPLFELGTCSAPCTGQIDRSGYAQNVQSAVDLLAAPPSRLLDGLDRIAEAAAQRGQAPRARRLRQQIQVIDQGFARLPLYAKVDHDQDALVAGDGLAVIARVRGGTLDAVEFVATPRDPPGFVVEYYTGHPAPQEVVLPEAWSFPGAVNVTVAPEAGWPALLLDIARMNHQYRRTP